MKKILIMDDKVDLLKQLQSNITKFQVRTAETVEDAIKILESENISFFVVDLDLGYEKTGEIAYDLIFSKGKSIPAMVLSGKVISEEMREYLRGMGFSSVCAKDDPVKSASELVEEEALRILNDCVERIKQVKKNVEKSGIGGKPLLFNGEFNSINGWIKAIEDCKHIDDEEKLKTLIIDVCMVIRRRQDGYGFDMMP